ncbi:DUF2125 domain-containing protein [Breoghania sp. L-A4]|nr:DUF2125 domain-containing protein [Breoghania sp. L-A4]AXS38756.1 DUF2125 domain-containing protein [Breoghania sp. L-A4]
MDRFIGEMRAGGRPVAVEAAQLSLGSTRLSARGSLTLDTAGTLSGELDVTVVEPEGLARLLAPLFPRDSTLPTSFQGVMDGFGSTTTVDGHPALEARILVTKGQMRIGLVPFAQIPPLP